MALKRFATGTPYGCVEMNFATWPRDGRVPSQLPLSKEFEEVRCENGFWLVYDELKKEVRKPTAADEAIVLVYSAEKDYGMIGQRGLGYFSQGAGDMPRTGRMVIGDKYTTNTFAYDDQEFADDAAVVSAMATLADTPLYVVADPAGDGAPKLTKTKPDAGTYGQVIKYYTVPNGQPGVKIEILSANS